MHIVFMFVRLNILLCIVQDDGVAAVLVFAPNCTNCTPPVFDAGGCTAIGSATIDRSATTNLQDPSSANC